MAEETFDMISPAGLQKVPVSQLSKRKNEGWKLFEPKAKTAPKASSSENKKVVDVPVEEKPKAGKKTQRGK